MTVLSTLSSNVVLAKARAMYGRRLTDEDYAAMLKFRTVGEVASFLKKSSRYSMELASVDESTVHRGYLELLLRQKLFDDYASLCRYELTIGEQFSKYIIKKGEIEELLSCLRLLHAGRLRESLLSFPSFFTKYIHFDLYALAKVSDYDEFLEALSGTEYRGILEKFHPKKGKLLDFTAIENALYTNLYQEFFSIIRHHAPRATRKELLDLLGSYIDLENVTRIVRLKHFYNSSPEAIRSVLLPFSYHISDKLQNRMLNADTSDDVKKILREDSNYRRSMTRYEERNIDEIAIRVRFDQCLRALRFSIHPPVVMLTYLFLSEIELQNIINIIEGIRYKLPSKEIMELLVGYHTMGKG